MGLFGFLRRDRATVEDLLALVGDLEKRVATLEAEQHPARLMEWHDLAEKLKRYLSRISAVEQRAKDRDEPRGDDKTAARALLLHTKFPQQNGS